MEVTADRATAPERVVREEHDVSLLDRHVDDDRPLRDVAAALQQARHQQLILIGEPQARRAGDDCGGMMLSGVRICSSVGIAYCHGCGAAGAAGAAFRRIELRQALRLIRIVGRAASGRPCAPPPAPPPRPPPPPHRRSR